MVFHDTTDAELRKIPVIYWHNDPWSATAGYYEELSRTCIFCNFTAKHRGALKRHIVRMHLE